MRQKSGLLHRSVLRPGLQHWLVISCAFSCLLLTARVLITGYMTYTFLLWNLFLGVVPYLVSHWLWTHSWITARRIQFTALLTVWLLFIPNTFYILTDLFHLDKFDSAPKWFDLLLIFSFAWNGMTLGIMSIRQVQILLEFVTGRKFSIVLLLIVMWLNAFGIYLGRYLRFNSWDVLVQPYALLREMADVLLHPVRNRMEWGMIAVYAIFMTLLYLTVTRLGDRAHSFKPNNQS